MIIRRHIEGVKVIAKENGYRFFIPARNFLKVFNKFNDEHKDERLQYIKKMLSRKDGAKYPEKLKEEIKELLKSGGKKSDIAVKYGIPYKTLEKWKFLTPSSFFIIISKIQYRIINTVLFNNMLLSAVAWLSSVP